MKNSVSKENDPQERHFSRLAIVGTAVLPFGFLLVLFLNPRSSPTFPIGESTWQLMLSYALLLLAVMAPFTSTILGLLSISQIRNSDGMVYGLPLAVFTSLFYPLIGLSLFLVFIGWSFLASISGSSLIPLAWLFVILLIDYLIVRFAWRKAKQH